MRELLKQALAALKTCDIDYDYDEEPTAEDKIYDAISVAYTKELVKYMREQQAKYKFITEKLKEKNT